MLRPWELQITIDANGEKAIYIQIADAIIVAIKTGKLNSGDALPGSRLLAAKLKLNRNTIIDAIDVLLAEGWLVSVARKGTFVAPTLPQAKPLKTETIAELIQRPKTAAEINFDDGLPDTRIAPIKELAAAYRQIFSRKGKWQMMGYSDEAGETDFKGAIVQMLNYNRSMGLTTGEVFITRGSQMAMFLAAHCLLCSGDFVAVENPGYQPAWQAFEHAGARLVPIGVDADGLKVDELRDVLASGKKIKAIYVTPHHQFPTTVTLSLSRRLALVSLSNEYGFTIIEDDYDHEFHYGARPILPVCSMENLKNYIYIGTMSKIIAPALRIGYLASSNSFIEKVARLRKIIDVQGDNMMEQAILQLIQDGHIKRHLRKATLHYKAKRDLFEKLIVEHLGPRVHFKKPDGGLAFWLVPNARIDLLKFTQLLLSKGVALISPGDFSFESPVYGLRLGFGSLSEDELKSGIKTMARLLDEVV